ncbi:MAG: hypothetical protein A2143_12805 [Gallionellales bacterium RBG_16_57_15]|nr:MAG: hypothetical protein A2143_12805 [Gallionellales bacterium RBG_16_57_15]
MTNLPIGQHTPQQTASAGNALQTNIQADDQTARGPLGTGAASIGCADSTQAKDRGGLADADDPAAGITEPFSEFLARQMGEPDPHIPVTVRDPFGIDSDAATAGADTAAIETPGQIAAPISASGDPAGILAAMLLQIPVPGDRGQGATDSGRPQLPKGSGEIMQLPDGGFQQTAGRSLPADIPLPASGNSQHAVPAGYIPLSTGGIENMEMAANSANPPQAGTNIAQTITPSALPAMVPNIQGYNTSGTIQTLTTPLRNNGWTEEFAQKISWMCTQQNQVAELHLSPPDLGPLEVVLKISGNQATVLFTSPHGAVRDAVENGLPKLREILADNGIMLGNATVSDRSPQGHGADGSNHQGSGAVAQRAILDEASNTAGLSPAASQNAPARRHNGMVDTYA